MLDTVPSPIPQVLAISFLDFLEGIIVLLRLSFHLNFISHKFLTSILVPLFLNASKLY